MSAYNSYTAGFLPHAGGMNDQAALFQANMQLFAHAYNVCEAKKPGKGKR